MDLESDHVSADCEWTNHSHERSTSGAQRGPARPHWRRKDARVKPRGWRLRALLNLLGIVDWDHGLRDSHLTRLRGARDRMQVGGVRLETAFGTRHPNASDRVTVLGGHFAGAWRSVG